MLVGLQLNHWIQPHKTLAHKMRFTSTLLNFLDYVVAAELGASSAASGSPGKPIIRAIQLCTPIPAPKDEQDVQMPNGDKADLLPSMA